MIKIQTKVRLTAALIFLVLSLSACLTQEFDHQESPSAVEPEINSAEKLELTATEVSTKTPQPTNTALPSPTATVVLSPDPIEVSFSLEDGTVISGKYYPGEINPAPVVVVFPWANGDQDDWVEIAGWIQNRGLVFDDGNRYPWVNETWFPARSEIPAMSVFTVDFRECTGGCKSWLSSEWVADARRAIETAAELHGVDEKMVVTMGASIGADAAVEACSWLNQSGKGRCHGFFAVSPGSYLTIPYDQTVTRLNEQDPEINNVCAFARRDDAAWETCESAPEEKLIDFGYVELHGMELFQPGLQHNLLEEVDRFMREAVLTLP